MQILFYLGNSVINLAHNSNASGKDKGKNNYRKSACNTKYPRKDQSQIVFYRQRQQILGTLAARRTAVGPKSMLRQKVSLEI